MKHTRGQLVVMEERDLVIVKSSKTIAEVLDTAEGLEGDCPEADANAERLALCWNQHDSLTAKAGLLDEAAKAMLACVSRLVEARPYLGPIFGQIAIEQARAVLAKVAQTDASKGGE